MLYVFIEIQACENKSISGCLKILNTISPKQRLINFVYIKNTNALIEKNLCIMTDPL